MDGAIAYCLPSTYCQHIPHHQVLANAPTTFYNEGHSDFDVCTLMSDKLKPDWAGNDLLSQIVNVLIQTKPIYKVMKRQARQVIVKTAEKNGIPWRKNYEELEVSGAKERLEQIVNKNITYPDYYHKIGSKAPPF